MVPGPGFGNASLNFFVYERSEIIILPLTNNGISAWLNGAKIAPDVMIVSKLQNKLLPERNFRN